MKHFIIRDYSNDDSNFIEVTCSGSCTPEITLDVEREESYYYSPLALMSLLDYDMGMSTLGRVAVTQTLFNNDPDFEYVSPLYEEGVYQPDVEELKWKNEVDFFYMTMAHILPLKPDGLSK